MRAPQFAERDMENLSARNMPLRGGNDRYPGSQQYKSLTIGALIDFHHEIRGNVPLHLDSLEHPYTVIQSRVFRRVRR